VYDAVQVIVFPFAVIRFMVYDAVLTNAFAEVNVTVPLFPSITVKVTGFNVAVFPSIVADVIVTLDEPVF
jgi:hypothetical protein